MEDEYRLLPRGGWDRIVLGAISLPIAGFFGFTAFVIMMVDLGQKGLLMSSIVFVLEELLIATSGTFLLGFIWAVATPNWVERFYNAAWKHMFFAIVLAAIPVVIMIGMALLGFKFNAEM